MITPYSNYIETLLTMGGDLRLKKNTGPLQLGLLVLRFECLCCVSCVYRGVPLTAWCCCCSGTACGRRTAVRKQEELMEEGQLLLEHNHPGAGFQRIFSKVKAKSKGFSCVSLCMLFIYVRVFYSELNYTCLFNERGSAGTWNHSMLAHFPRQQLAAAAAATTAVLLLPCHRCPLAFFSSFSPSLALLLLLLLYESSMPRLSTVDASWL